MQASEASVDGWHLTGGACWSTRLGDAVGGWHRLPLGGRYTGGTIQEWSKMLLIQQASMDGWHVVWFAVTNLAHGVF